MGGGEGEEDIAHFPISMCVCRRNADSEREKIFFRTLRSGEESKKKITTLI